MTFTQTPTLTLDQKKDIFTLWNKVSPVAVSHNSMQAFDLYLASLDGVIYTLVLGEDSRVVGWFADFDRDGDRWFAMLLDSSIHGKGVGSELLARAKERHQSLNGWVIDHGNDKTLSGDSYISPVNFYLKNGLTIVSEVRLELDNLSCVKMNWEGNL
jgi:GNAT superfamily N-acetyltransferase